ncbi:hypothetical protein Vretimale_7232 [Volvox reticuliferus]|uniref:Uncharacterized protein n=1 Tax=Volvox reticuliferus TaxID=1737510 RepID=A0A8J4G8X6_9CHLO|nr:hypothetical protein Vretimale_7232 [Volvox reticuliferus]
MAELPGLEELLLGGYDVNALLASAQGQSGGQGLGVLGLEAQLQLKPSSLTQQTLGWPAAAPTDQNDLYQVAQSLAAKIEEHRLQQVQMATALQQLQALQQQQELAQLQQQLNALHQHVPRVANPFQRSRTTDLESLGRGSSFDAVATYGPSLDFEQQQKQLAALHQATNPAAQLVGLQRIPGVIGQHNLPVRSFSSEHLVVGQRRPAVQMPGAHAGQPMQPLANNKRPPIRQPSGLGPNGRSGPNGRNGAEGGRRARYAATAKAPSWASEDWHPMKAVIASGAQASSGTGVFLPNLSASGASSSSASSAASALSSGCGGGKGAGGNVCARLSERSSGENVVAVLTASQPQGGGAAGGGGQHLHGLSGVATASAAIGGGVLAFHHPQVPSHQSQSPASPIGEGSPSCSVDSNAICSTVGGCDPYSRQTTIEFSRGSSHSELESHPTTSFGYLVDTMKVVVEEPEREREDANEECDFVTLARELAELMSKQVISE